MGTIKQRTIELVEKLISFKFVIFIITCILRVCGVIGNAEWLTVTGLVLGGHVGMKGIHTILNRQMNQGECGE